jgi:glycosyltransferase involved in cell wall biosynthesis
MARIVMADDGVAFDGRVADRAPLGGAEGAFVSLAESLAARGHRVEVYNRCEKPLAYKGVRWTPLTRERAPACELLIGNRGSGLLGLARRTGRRLFWLHNPASYLKKPRNLAALLRYRPTLVVTGAYHAGTLPRWLPRGGLAVIPYGVRERFRSSAPRPPPPPRAIFTSNPLRGLDWLLELWVRRIKPAVPEAELHIYAGAAVYGAAARKAGEMEAVLARAETLASAGVRCHAPVACEALAKALGEARAMLYRGDPGETFCLALAEAQAMGVPAVVTPLGAVPERVIDGETGRVAADEAEFAAAAIRLLADDALWQRWHQAALERQGGLSWDAVAQRFEALLR